MVFPGPCFFPFQQDSHLRCIKPIKISAISTEKFHIRVIDKNDVFLYNDVVKKNIDRTAILTDMRITAGECSVFGLTYPADRLGISVYRS